MNLSDQTKEFLLSEYSALRSTFQSHVSQIVSDQQLGLAATGAFWTWTATHKIEWGWPYLVWIPTMLCVLFFIKWLVFHSSLMRLSRYLRSIEDRFELPTGAGWSTNFKNYGRDLLAPTTTTFWLILIAANVAAAIAIPRVPFAIEPK